MSAFDVMLRKLVSPFTDAVKPVADTSERLANDVFHDTGVPPTPAISAINDASGGASLLTGLADITEDVVEGEELEDGTVGRTVNEAIGFFGPMVAERVAPGTGDLVGSMLDWAKMWVDLVSSDGADVATGKALSNLFAPGMAPRPEDADEGPWRMGSMPSSMHPELRSERQWRRAAKRGLPEPVRSEDERKKDEGWDW